MVLSAILCLYPKLSCVFCIAYFRLRSMREVPQGAEVEAVAEVEV